MDQSGQMSFPIRRDSSAEEANFRASLCESPNSNVPVTLQKPNLSEFPEVQVIDYHGASPINGTLG